MTRLTPTPEQEKAIQRMGSEPTRAALQGSELGVGKTLMAVETVKRLGNDLNLITAPLHTRDGWERTFDSQGAGELRYVNTKNKAGRQAMSDLLFGVPGNYFMGRELARLQDWSQTDIGTFVVDECFVAGTLISTPRGDIPIEKLVPGDVVYGFDHESGKVVESRVKHSMTRETSEIFANGATPNHPYYVKGAGYLPIADLVDGDIVYGIQESSGMQVQPLRVNISDSPKRGQEILFEKLRIQSGMGGAPGVDETSARCSACKNGGTRTSRTDVAIDSRAQSDRHGMAGKDSEPDEESESRCGPRVAPQNGRKAEGESRELESLERRERYRADKSREDFVKCSWLGNSSSYRHENASRERVPHELQGRRCECGLESGGGVRREQPLVAHSTGAGPQEDSAIGVHGVDHLAILEPRDRGRYRQMLARSARSSPVKVYNLETESSNYFAGGILVHNCHSLVSPKSRGFKAYAKPGTYSKQKQHMNAEFRLYQSATWFGASFDGAWAIARQLWPERDGFGDIADRFDYRWRDEWCVSEYNEIWTKDENLVRKLKFSDKGAVLEEKPGRWKVRLGKVAGEKEPGKFVQSIPCYVKIKNDLPEMDVIEIRYELTPVQRRMYREMEQQSLVWLKDNPLSVDLPVVQRIRLRDITLAEPILLDDGTVDYAPDARSALYDTATEMLGDLIGEQVLMGTHSAKFARYAARRMGNAFAWAGSAGDEEQAEAKRRFIAGDIPVIVGTQAKLGEGIDGFQYAAHVMFELSLNDNPILNQQFRGRLRRPGQSKPVICYRFVAEGTLDDPQHESLLKKELAMRASVQ